MLKTKRNNIASNVFFCEIGMTLVGSPVQSTVIMGGKGQLLRRLPRSLLVQCHAMSFIIYQRARLTKIHINIYLSQQEGYSYTQRISQRGGILFPLQLMGLYVIMTMCLWAFSIGQVNSDFLLVQQYSLLKNKRFCS